MQSAHTLVVAARCRLAGVNNVELALLDTGAQWTLIGGELVDLVEPFASSMRWSITYSTRLGNVEAHCYRLDIELVADEGDDLLVNATVLLAKDWKGPPIVLGYRGLLERVRLALDPGVGEDDQWLAFGG